ncbi:MAG TPA: hypothetical protein VFR02_06985 [bacterium]|nr:hypothetical protein [bacterium]
MRKISIPFILVLALSGASILWAEEGTPVPVPPDLNNAAPITDLGPVDLPALPDLDGTAPPSNTQAPSLPAEAPAPKAAPAAPAPVPTRVPTLAPTPVPTPIPAAPQAPTAGPSSQAAMPAPAATGGLEDYFPWTQGASLKYEYLKPRPGSSVKGTRLVECVSREVMPNGTLHFTLRTTEGGRVVEDRYSLYDNKVQHTFAGKQALADHVILEWPVDGQPVEWKLPGGDGQTHAFKVFPGKEKVYQKVYPDCLIVVDKAGNSSRFEYYAKGIGLVAVETYGRGMKLIEDESLALVQTQP